MSTLTYPIQSQIPSIIQLKQLSQYDIVDIVAILNNCLNCGNYSLQSKDGKNLKKSVTRINFITTNWFINEKNQTLRKLVKY